METGNDGSWKEFLGKYITLIYDDCGSFPKKKAGILLAETPTHLILKIDSHQEAILLAKILRVECGK